MVLDEAYTSIGGDQHLCPYSKAQMRKARSAVVGGEVEYGKMRVFCNLLSSQRITIERAFGMFIRKFGIIRRLEEEGMKSRLHLPERRSEARSKGSAEYLARRLGRR
jgi:hypothetical protein